jgi:hypothetical protein
MYNPKTKKIVRSRDVKWLEWETLDPKHDMSIFVKQPELLNEPMGFDDKEYPPPPITFQAPRSTLILDDDDSDTKAGRMNQRRGEDNDDGTSALEPNNTITDEDTHTEPNNRKKAVQRAAAKQSKINPELKKLDVSFNPTGM